MPGDGAIRGGGNAVPKAPAGGERNKVFARERRFHGDVLISKGGATTSMTIVALTTKTASSRERVIGAAVQKVPHREERRPDHGAAGDQPSRAIGKLSPPRQSHGRLGLGDTAWTRTLRQPRGAKRVKFASKTPARTSDRSGPRYAVASQQTVVQRSL